jgi:hypothetical protein
MTEHAAQTQEMASTLEAWAKRDRAAAVALQDGACGVGEIADNVQAMVEQGAPLPREYVNFRKDAQMVFLAHLAGGSKNIDIVDGRLVMKRKPTSSD